MIGRKLKTGSAVSDLAFAASLQMKSSQCSIAPKTFHVKPSVEKVVWDAEGCDKSESNKSQTLSKHKLHENVWNAGIDFASLFFWSLTYSFLESDPCSVPIVSGTPILSELEQPDQESEERSCGVVSLFITLGGDCWMAYSVSHSLSHM